MHLKPCWKWSATFEHLVYQRSYSIMAKRRVGGGRPPSQKKPPLTHFLCVPLVTPASRPQLEASLKLFKDQVSPAANEAVDNAELKGDEDVILPCVHPKAIRPLRTLHCTLGVMSLDKERLDEAISLLRSIDISVLLTDSAKDADNAALSETSAANDTSMDLSTLQKPISPPAMEEAGEPLKVDLKGLVSMHSRKSTSILYSAPSDQTGRLLPFCIALQKRFQEQGFITDDRPLKLHATIVNTIYAKGRNRPPRGGAFKSSFAKTEEGSVTQQSGFQDHGPNANAPLKIDATTILEKYEGFVWAKDVVLDRIAICEMGAKKVLDEEGNVVDEAYTEVASIALPV